jgi:LPS-assembly protein
MPPARAHRVLLALALGATFGVAHAEDAPVQCFGDVPPESRDAGTPRLSRETLSSAPIDVASDTATLGVNGDAVLEGNVRVTQGDREIRADRVEYDAERGGIDVQGNVEYRDPLLIVQGGGGRYSATEGASFSGTRFELPSRPARGTAGELRLDPDGRVTLESVTFTTCPVTDPAWQLRANDIVLDTTTRTGTARNTRVDFLGVPILYSPWLTFPLGSERKSGFLFPGIGYSTRSGWQANVPYYFNLAPNYDAVFNPVWMSDRGVDLTGNFRYLTRSMRGTFDYAWLPDDRLYGAERSFLQLEHVQELPADWRFTIDAGNASDTQYFEDFGLGPDGTSVAFVERLATFTYRDPHWRLGAAFQDFQTIDTDLPADERPYTMVPQIAAAGDWSLGDRGQLLFGFEAEVVNFDRNTGVTGWRYDVAPRIAFDWQGPGYFVRPALTWRATGYQLDDTAPGEPDSPSRTLPTASLDTGLIFEGAAGSRGQRRITLEPRALYVYTPYRNQDDLPIFDTAIPDLNLVLLFRTNRYVGPDRVSDANEVSVGVTSRLFDADSGRQLLAASIGQRYSFDPPRVTLPDEEPITRSTSNFIGQLDLTALDDWNAIVGLEWDPDESQFERAQVRVQYRPGPVRVVNLAYRYQRGRIDQVDGSVAWPIAEKWSLFGRYVYSLAEDEAIDQFAGFEYRSCCWRVRLLGQRFVSSRTGEQDTGAFLQLELSGLASVGSSAVAFLEEEIRGYSPATLSR